MVGRDVVLKIEKEDPTVGKTVLKIRNLVKNSASGKRVLDDVSFDIHEGEVIGIAGVEGNGQSALSDVLAGMESFSSGTVELNGHDIKGKNVHEIRQMQKETSDALTRVRQKGSISFTGLKDVGGSLKRLEIGSSLNITELLAISSMLTIAARAKAYGRHEDDDEYEDSLEEMFRLLEPLTPLNNEIKRLYPL